MKKLQKAPSMITRFFALLTLTLMSAVSWAQDKGLDIDVDVDKGGGWYQNPIIWVIGGAVFILLLVALLRSGKSDT